MIKISIQLFFVLMFSGNISAQTMSEKEIFKLNYKGMADAFYYVQDSVSRNYCYFYRVVDENKTFIISNNSISEKFDYAGPEDLKFDSKGNYYVVTSNYKADYGIDNNFLVVNGKVVKNYDQIDSYSSYIDKAGEFVFVFKENDLYKIGYYSIDNAFRQSDGYDNIRAIYKYVDAQQSSEGESEGYGNSDYYFNDNGERGFIALANGKAKIIFETSEIATDYSDINESSLTMNRNNELSFIAKNGGKFFEKVGNEFVVSGSKEYDKFELASAPLKFNNNNVPVYIAGDSLAELKYNYFLVIGNQIQNAVFDNGKSVETLNFSSYPSDVKLKDDGSITYYGASDSIVPAKKKFPGEEVYDQFYSRMFYVKSGNAYVLGYNTGLVKYNDRGDMLYSGMADINKTDKLLMMNYGSSRIIINKKKFDDVYDYGFSPAKVIYYAGQIYGKEKPGAEDKTYLYLGNKLIGKYDYLSYQYSGNTSSILVFDSGKNFAFVALERVDSITFKNVVFTNDGKLPFPDTKVPGANSFSMVSYLMYSGNDKLFYIGDIYSASPDEPVRKEVFVNNESVGEIYNTISNFKYNASANEVTFLGSRGDRLYSVTVSF